ncbi:hypothetical protein FRC16_008115, partial [Serendipita sp. 398]
ALQMRMNGAQGMPPMMPVHMQQPMGIQPNFQGNPQGGMPTFQQQQQQQQQQQAALAARNIQSRNHQLLEMQLNGLGPEQIQALIARASETTKAQTWWQTASDREKAKHMIINFHRLRYANALAANNNGGVVRQ